MYEVNVKLSQGLLQREEKTLRSSGQTCGCFSETEYSNQEWDVVGGWLFFETKTYN